MKNPLLLVSVGMFCVVLPLRHAVAQTAFNPGAAGANPFGQFHNPPPNPVPAATPFNAAILGTPGGMQTPYNNSAAASYSNEPVEPNHKLNRSDVLNFQVVEERDPRWHEGQVTVLDSGDINMPLGGLVPAAGKTVAQLTSDVREKLERDYYYHATVIMGISQEARRPSRGRVYVVGAVRTEGPVELPLDEPLTASEAIFRAGGFKDFGSKNVQILRKGSTGKPLVVKVGDVLKGKLDKDTVLEPGDKVLVKEKMFNFGQ